MLRAFVLAGFCLAGLSRGGFSSFLLCCGVFVGWLGVVGVSGLGEVGWWWFCRFFLRAICWWGFCGVLRALVLGCLFDGLLGVLDCVRFGLGLVVGDGFVGFWGVCGRCCGVVWWCWCFVFVWVGFGGCVGFGVW